MVQLFEEVKRHKPSVIYIPNVNVWYDTITDATKRTFVGLLRGLAPTEPVLLLGIMEEDLSETSAETNAKMINDLFGYSRKNQYRLNRPAQSARDDFFGGVVEYIRMAPAQFPSQTRKKRKLEELPEAPPPPPPPGPTRAELKAQKKKDHQTLNHLKLHIQKVMDQIKLKYRQFRTPPVDDATIAYLFDEQDPRVLTTDLTEQQREQRQLFRPYEKDKDSKGVSGLREVASSKFYYNLEIVTIEKRLSNGYYKRPKDFTTDIKYLAKDAQTMGDQARLFKAKEMLANVEVDMTELEQQQPLLCAECEAVYEREQQRALRQAEKAREAKDRGEQVPKIIPNVPHTQVSKTTTETSGPIMLGPEMSGGPLFPVTPTRAGGPSQGSNHGSTTQTNGSHESHHTNGSTVPSRPQQDSEMPDRPDESQDESEAHNAFARPFPQIRPENEPATQQGGQDVFSQRSTQSHPAPDQHSNPDQESASTTNSEHKSSDRSSGAFAGNDETSSSGNTHTSNGTGVPDFNSMAQRGGSQMPSTQDPSVASQPNSSGSQAFEDSPSSERMAPPHQKRQPSFPHSLMNPVDEDEDDEATTSNHLILDNDQLNKLHAELVSRSSGLSLEQLEQVNAGLMDVIWSMRDNWNRNQVCHAVKATFNETVEDIETSQELMGPSQENDE